VTNEFEAARHVVTVILQSRECGVPLRDQAVLFRAAHHSTALEVELRRARIPFEKWGGLKLLEAAHIKDLIALLRLLANPLDKISALRVLLLMPGVGPVSAQAILRGIQVADDTLVANSQWADLKTLRLRALGAEALEAIAMARAWLEPLLNARYENFAQRRTDLDVLCQIASASRSLQDFLTELALDPVDCARPNSIGLGCEDDALVLSTIHSAKGQEWRSVYLLNVAEGALPLARASAAQAAIEEERRLLYVAMTRARDELYLICPSADEGIRSDHWAGRRRLLTRSRFLPDRVLPAFERVAWSGDGAASRPSLPCAEISAQPV